VNRFAGEANVRRRRHRHTADFRSSRPFRYGENGAKGAETVGVRLVSGRAGGQRGRQPSRCQSGNGVGETFRCRSPSPRTRTASFSRCD
jgi:hypothetical protein